jgi:hypothetical protein
VNSGVSLSWGGIRRWSMKFPSWNGFWDEDNVRISGFY